MHKAWSSIEEVPYCFSMSYVKFQGHTAKKIVDFDPNWVFPDCNSSLNPSNLPCLSHSDFCIFSFNQAALWLVQSVCLSVTPFSLCSHHHIIMKFSGVITIDRSVHAKGQGQRSKVKATEVNIQLSCFLIVTPVWIHIWQWNHAHSLK